jgi:hypothetical protein
MTLHPSSLSAIIPVLEDAADLGAATRATSARWHRWPSGSTSSTSWTVPLPQALAALRELKRRAGSVEVLCFPQSMGEAAALSVGLQAAMGEVAVTLTAEPHVEDADLARLVAALEVADVAVARRSHVMDETGGRGRRLDHIVNRLFKTNRRDIRSGVRAMRAEAARELTVYGNQFRFLPLVAEAQGFRVAEVDVRSMRPRSSGRGLLPFDPSLVLDVVAIYFLIRFLRKPFRFFGGFGFSVLVLGLMLTAWLVAARLFFGVPLVDRPALILSTLMIVLGLQIISVGLIGEIITFAYAKDTRDYRVERLVEPEMALLREPSIP